MAGRNQPYLPHEYEAWLAAATLIIGSTEVDRPRRAVEQDVSGKPTSSFRTLDDRYAPPHFTSARAVDQRAAYVREHVLASAGLLPCPDRAPLKPVVFDEIVHEDYAVAKVYFESLPGFFVTGNLYRPSGDGPFPAVLSPHGHWPYGRVENTT